MVHAVVLWLNISKSKTATKIDSKENKPSNGSKKPRITHGGKPPAFNKKRAKENTFSCPNPPFWSVVLPIRTLSYETFYQIKKVIFGK